MTISTYLSVNIKIIKQNKFTGNGMLIWCYIFTKKNKIGISVTFRHITQYLVVGTVFLNDIKNIFYWRCITYFHGNRISCSTFRYHLFFFSIRGIIINSL